MISDILDIRQHRSTRQAAMVRHCKESLAFLKSALTKAERELSDHLVSKAAEEHALFSALSRQPASLHKLEDFNDAVAELAQRAEELARAAAKLKKEATQAKVILSDAVEELNMFRRKEQKFAELVDRVLSEERQKNELQQYDQAEELAADIFMSIRGSR